MTACATLPSTDPIVELTLVRQSPDVLPAWFICPLCHGGVNDVFCGDYERVVKHVESQHHVTVTETKVVLDTTWRGHERT